MVPRECPHNRGSTMTASATAQGNSQNFFARAKKMIGLFLMGVFFPIKLIFGRMVFKVSKDMNEVTFTSLHKAFFLWPVAALAWFAPIVHSWGWVSEATLGQVGYWMIAYMVLLAFFDLDFWKTVIAVVSIGFILFAGRELEVFAVKDLASYFFGTEPGWDRGLYQGLGRLCGWIQILFVIPHAFLFGRWQLSTRELVHFSMFRRQYGHNRAGLTAVIAWPDLLESLATFMGGQLELRKGERTEVEVRHVPFLLFFEKSLTEILDRVATREENELEVAATDEGS